MPLHQSSRAVSLQHLQQQALQVRRRLMLTSGGRRAAGGHGGGPKLAGRSARVLISSSCALLHMGDLCSQETYAGAGRQVVLGGAAVLLLLWLTVGLVVFDTCCCWGGVEYVCMEPGFSSTAMRGAGCVSVTCCLWTDRTYATHSCEQIFG